MIRLDFRPWISVVFFGESLGDLMGHAILRDSCPLLPIWLNYILSYPSTGYQIERYNVPSISKVAGTWLCRVCQLWHTLTVSVFLFYNILGYVNWGVVYLYYYFLMFHTIQEIKESVQSDFRHQVSLLVHPMLQVSTISCSHRSFDVARFHELNKKNLVVGSGCGICTLRCRCTEEIC